LYFIPTEPAANWTFGSPSSTAGVDASQQDHFKEMFMFTYLVSSNIKRNVGDAALQILPYGRRRSLQGNETKMYLETAIA